MGDNKFDEKVNSVNKRIGKKSFGEGIKDNIDLKKEGINHKLDDLNDRLDKTNQFMDDLGKIKGNNKLDTFGKKAKFVGGKAAKASKKAIQESEKFQKLVMKIQKIATFIATNGLYILIAIVVIIVLAKLAIKGAGLAQVVHHSPHYYCDTEASPSVKETAVYQQYCGEKDDFNLDNLQGHYVTQDGSGPCTDCATVNMLMRFYTIQGVNFYDYLWDETGMYSDKGLTVNSSTTVRHAINGGTCEGSDTTCGSSPSGTRAFANAHGKPGWNMANWGYLRDESVNFDEGADTSEMNSNENSDKWVWDLSLDSGAPGTSWAVTWQQQYTIENITVNEVTVDGEVITGETIKSLLVDNAVNGNAGILLYYDYDGDGKGNHAVLITKYDEDTGYWWIIDSAKGLAGGYEGPMDGSGNFAWEEGRLVSLLDSGQHTQGVMGIVRLCYLAM